jgi:sn-glycerol 3-phosphate transport system permease protein
VSEAATPAPAGAIAPTDAAMRRKGRLAASRRRAASQAGVKASGFEGQLTPLLLLAPQLLILLLFFFIPAGRTLTQAFTLQDPFGQEVIFVGLENIRALLRSAEYLASVRISVVFTLATTVLTLGVGLLLAFASDRILRLRSVYRTVLLVPYAIAPAVAGIIWAFLFNPVVGPAAFLLHALGIPWNPTRIGDHALVLVVLAASWKHVCYNYIFLLAALAAVPRTVIEASAVDGATPLRRFFAIQLPMIMPTVFFLTVMNIVHGLFETFAIIDATTRGGPAAATSILVYKVYVDGFVNLDLGGSAAQSLLLMGFAMILTFIQFRALDRRISYEVSQ